MGNELKDIGEMADQAPGPRREEPYYSSAGDCIFFYIRDEESYAERVDEVITVYRAIDGDAVTGFQLKGISAIVEMVEKVGSFSSTEMDLATLMLLQRGAHCMSENDRYAELVPHASRGRIDMTEFQAV